MADGTSELRLITFRVGSETFVLDIMAVRQIVPYDGTTSIPTAPDFVEGIIVLRNEVIPVIDLRTRLYPRMEKAPQPLILITHTTAGMIGFKVDEVRRIVTVSTDAFLPPPAIVRGIRGELLIGVVPYAEEVYLLIDVENVLTVDEKDELRDAELREEAAQNAGEGTAATP
ncbi:MAG: purine-binding chemotaxis protein CheW [Acidobacteriota bacterium]|jgi:purine-binding chemotaxis protein CheW|nr:purine-binding chemotaxis protein CheW [Acidobacteriota bacterium]